MKYQGIVKKHTRNGTKFGYPTANIEIADKSVDGLFVGYTSLIDSPDRNITEIFAGRRLPSIIFIGAPMTLGESWHRLESFILDFPLIDLYGVVIKVEVKDKLRSNRRFQSIAKLIDQMKRDEINAREYFNKSSEL